MMQSASIARRTGAASEGSYASLRSEGIRLVQALSGQVWTDYNLHDPGVTILEQFCYALTDLIYRCDFDTADYLTGESGQIDLEQLALYRPERIFPSDAVTINDYRKLIFDAVPEIDNLWIEPLNEGIARGLYRIHAQLAQWVEEEAVAETEGQVIDQIRTVFAAHRNLGEDLEEVRIISQQHYSLHGTIEIDNQPEPEEILGDLYFRVSQFIRHSLPSHTYLEAIAQGLSLAEIFTGPLTQRAYIGDADLAQDRRSVTISDVIGVIDSVAGVRYTDRLWFEDDQGNRLTTIPYAPYLELFPHLRMPSTLQEMGIAVRRSGREYQVPFREVEHVVDRYLAEYRSRRRTRQDFSDVYALPQGEFREVRSYYSVQHHFPNTYGINQFGLPESEPPRRKSQAKNLKAYLLFFEQIMANFLENLQEIPRLFSVDTELQQTYFYQVLDDDNVPNVEELYQDHAGLAGQLDAIRQRYDRVGDRRNRILDYLLGLYGESFNEEALARYDSYGEYSRAAATAQAKIDLLKLIGEPR